ncbi:hypothetical protein EVAR_23759_1 [Eumeta japonica]|uniref:Secreted protein n=1 Tax=Eumeta variegata TaxID=151549 RepID=A0A4C1VGF9_EUMVA|nr:hypothetical protein EVAR_23759_1 [Eumeta japonica]
MRALQLSILAVASLSLSTSGHRGKRVCLKGEAAHGVCCGEEKMYAVQGSVIKLFRSARSFYKCATVILRSVSLEYTLWVTTNSFPSSSKKRLLADVDRLQG